MMWKVAGILFWILSNSWSLAVSADSQIVAKFIGQKVEQDTLAGVRVLNDNFKTVRGSDLGAMAVYRGRIYFLLGDTLWGGGGFDGYTRNYVMAFSKPLANLNLESGVELEGYIGGGPTRLMTESGYYIPTALVKINWNGQEYLFSHYMNVVEVAGNDHHINNSGIAKFNESSQRFEKYKDGIYKWQGSWRHFGMASFWPDYQSGYLYMAGSPSGRFGGVKLARIKLADFMGSSNSYWQYYLGNGVWSGATNDFNVIKTASWLIPPKDPNWSVVKDDWENLAWETQANVMTIGEYSLAYNDYLKKFIIMTGRNFNSGLKGGSYYYTADNIEGPWSQEILLASSKLKGYEWEPYGLFTTSDLNTEGGRNIYYVATSWGQDFPPTNYGIYWYKTRFGALETPTPSPTPAGPEGLSFECDGTTGVFSWNKTSGVNRYTFRIDFDDNPNKWPDGPFDEQRCVYDTTSNGKINQTVTLTNKPNKFNWSIQRVENNDTTCAGGYGITNKWSVSCGVTPTMTPTSIPTNTPTMSPTPTFTPDPSPTPTEVVIVGDANGDGEVDLTDLGIWKTEFAGQNGVSADFNGDGKVDLEDLGIWKTEYVKQ